MYHGEGKVTLWFLLKKQTERVRVIGSSNPAAFMSRSFNCPSKTRSRSTMHGCPPFFLSLGPTQQDTAQPKNVSAPARASLILKVKLWLQTKEMDQKKGGLSQRAMPLKPTEGSRIRPIASTYNVMITLVYPFSLVVQRTVAPPTRKGINMETSLPFGSENLWRKSGFKFAETTRLVSGPLTLSSLHFRQSGLKEERHRFYKFLQIFSLSQSGYKLNRWTR